MDLFERLLLTDHVHNVVGVLCYLQSVTESLSAAISATATPPHATTTSAQATTPLASTTAPDQTSTTSVEMTNADTTTTSLSSALLLPLWTSLVTALQNHLNTVSTPLMQLIVTANVPLFFITATAAK